MDDITDKTVWAFGGRGNMQLPFEKAIVTKVQVECAGLDIHSRVIVLLSI